MPSSSPAGDRRPVPTVAIVGNDVVLAAAPATPVQLAHACLRRGFSVAVPASWGDELIAAEAVRRLASRARGPAVMCVCPYARSHLLAPGPDLAPFLISLVSPPVATARYLRTVYGEHGVHITYLGGCPGADDPAIDTRLTPDAFLADLADHEIALSEQPLVFDSIVPPDRRRWCSLPGGVPSPEGLWSETETRTLVEIERDDASTELAQHIITREHVLLDLAPSLGCACSGAVGSPRPRTARAAVMALEPPRALGPIIDPAAVVPLDAPVDSPALGAGGEVAAPVVEVAVGADPALESVLDRILGAGPDNLHDDPGVESDLATTVTVDEPLVLGTAASEGAMTLPETTNDAGHDARSEVVSALVSAPESVVELPENMPDVAGGPDAPIEGPEPTAAPETAPTPTSDPSATEEPSHGESPVRRRTPSAVHARYSATTIPKAIGADGRPLPRAYVAKRRTPPSGAAIIPSVELSAASESAPPRRPAAVTPEVTAPPSDSRTASADAVSAPASRGDREPSPAPPASTAGKSPIDTPAAPDADARAGSVAAPPANQGALMFLLVTALVALGVFVLFALRR